MGKLRQVEAQYKSCRSIHDVLEPDFLEYLVQTFDRWQKLNDEKVTLGTREIAKFQDVLMGAKLNARYGFEAVHHRGISDEDSKEHYTLLIYKNREAMESEKPLYSFDTIIY
ncbi:MAG: hypothetical protein K2L07_15815 [Lachnospiraceae bacterium]|nr:hypothetical protein [Lachnospiraceae bacterium]